MIPNKNIVKETAQELRGIADKLDAMAENGVDIDELEMIARQEITPLVLALKDFAFEAKQAAQP